MGVELHNNNNYYYYHGKIITFVCSLLIIILSIEPQAPVNVTVVMPLFHPSYDAASSLNVTLEWDVESDPNNPMHLRQNNWISNYTVIVSNSPQTSNSGHIFYTSNTSLPLALHYDWDYNISVMATNCARNSTPAEVHIRLGKYSLEPHACML